MTGKWEGEGLGALETTKGWAGVTGGTWVRISEGGAAPHDNPGIGATEGPGSPGACC